MIKLDLKEVIMVTAREIQAGVDQAKKNLHNGAVIGEVTQFEVEMGITSTYELANYDDVTIAKVKFKVPLFTREAHTAMTKKTTSTKK